MADGPVFIFEVGISATTLGDAHRILEGALETIEELVARARFKETVLPDGRRLSLS